MSDKPTRIAERARVLANIIQALMTGEITAWQALAALNGLSERWNEK